jgi:hypothetical protein
MCKRSVKHMTDATTRGRLERIVRREGTRGERNLGTVAEIEVGKPERAPENFPLGVSEATASVVGKLTTPITVSEAGQRNVCDV